MVQLDSRYIDEQEVSSSGAPAGIVIMYDAEDWINDSTMPGWFVCDGTCGTPDMVDSFIKGACNISSCIGIDGGCSYLVLETCHLPVHSHTNPDHSHTICDHYHCMKCHKHQRAACAPSTGFGSALGCARATAVAGSSMSSIHLAGYVGGSYTDRSNACSGNNTHRHTVNSHSHAITACSPGYTGSTGGTATDCGIGDTNPAGESCSIDIRSAYYSLIFVKKIA